MSVQFLCHLQLNTQKLLLMSTSSTRWQCSHNLHKYTKVINIVYFSHAVAPPIRYTLNTWKQAQNLGKVQKRIANSSYCRSDGLTEWHGLTETDAVHISKVCQTVFENKKRSQIEKGWIEISIVFHRPGWNSEQNGNSKIFFYNSNCIFF